MHLFPIFSSYYKVTGMTYLGFQGDWNDTNAIFEGSLSEVYEKPMVDIAPRVLISTR